MKTQAEVLRDFMRGASRTLPDHMRTHLAEGKPISGQVDGRKVETTRLEGNAIVTRGENQEVIRTKAKGTILDPRP